MELSFQNFVGIFQIVAGLGTTGAFIYTGLVGSGILDVIISRSGSTNLKKILL